MKRITLCADDFGMHPAVNNAIASLIKADRIHATSCLVTSEYWQSSIGQLQALRDKADIGLHLNFTEGNGLSESFLEGLPSLNKMLIFSHLGLLNEQAIEEEIIAQYQAFLNDTGQHPDFIDGHQHVHHLPVVRSALLATIRRFQPENIWVRSVSPMNRFGGGFKSWVIEQSGAKKMAQILNTKGIRCNQSFAGIYSLTTQQNVRELMQEWLKDSSDSGLIMCHPAKSEAAVQVDHYSAREKEYSYLLGEQFLDDCQSAQVSLERLS
ncbi:hypothetical protein EOPP23_12335 [Endozoicomonas sp. OPT23]|uniref:ChbG/HpnK family deacetylase n=1 Tax=Endozoicomonas sp. OPT23 TaxID=2072845 RepID=UPI00129A2B30|nr:ChbG/HpnK family deacetylase [Endozoicomonas sp. OPT23]MRI33773.1 hypothetical protein [Endozoicomonas sp. OPT23]